MKTENNLMKTTFTYKQNSTYMKRILKISGVAFLIMLFAGLKNTASAQPMGEVSYQTFYDELSPYGRWVDYPDYGYVWCPDEGADFRPYSTNGRWVWSDDYDWMWVSDYSWGWAPFHYGRWFYDPIYGWMWVPGYDWSPAWVAWRGGGDYYGWAPIMPGINISIGFSWSNYNCPVDYWNFAPSRYINSYGIGGYCVSPRQNVTIINNTTIINNNVSYRRNVFVNGPGRRDVERYTNERIRSVRVRDAGAPGRAGFRNNEVNVYRPSVQRNDGDRNIAPRRFDNYRGNNNGIAQRNDIDRRSAAGDRLQRNNNSNSEGRISERGDNNGFGRRNSISERAERSDNVNNDVQRRNGDFNQRGNNTDWRSRRENPEVRQPDNNGTTDRNVFNRDNRRGIDRPVERRQLDRNDAQIRNENRVRNENNNNRNFNNAPARQERRSFEQQPRQERRTFDQPRQQQQQRQSFPEVNRRQEQPQQRRFEAPQRNNNSSSNGNEGNRRGGFRRQG